MKASFQRCLLYTKKVEIDISTHFLLSLGFPSSPLAEREGFEPPEPLSSTVFKTAAIDHSAISPRNRLQKYCFFLNCANIFEVFLRIWIFYSNFAENLHKKMLLQVLKSKIHRVTVTEANLDYIGSITIDEDLMEAANIYAGEKVQVVDNTNGARIETYVIPGQRGSGCICINGAAAHLVHVGDTVIIMAYALMTPEEVKEFKPSIVFPNNNHLA